MLIAITFHYVRGDYSQCSQGINGVTFAQFESQLALLGRHGTFVSASEVLAAVTGKAPLPDRSLLVTFDDGLREQYEGALPILQRMGIPAIFFVNTRPIAEEFICTVHKVHLMRSLTTPEQFQNALEKSARELGVDLNREADAIKASLQYPYDTPTAARLKFLINFVLPRKERDELVASTFELLFPGKERQMACDFYMTKSQVAKLMQLESLGTHGHDHLPIGQLDDDEARRMLAQSINYLEQWGGAKPYSLSYPYGIKDTCSPQTAAAAQDLGIQFAFTVEAAGNDRESLRNPQFLGRFDCNLLPGSQRPSIQAEGLFETVAKARWHHPEPATEVELATSFALNR